MCVSVNISMSMQAISICVCRGVYGDVAVVCVGMLMVMHQCVAVVSVVVAFDRVQCVSRVRSVSRAYAVHRSAVQQCECAV